MNQKLENIPDIVCPIGRFSGPQVIYIIMLIKINFVKNSPKMRDD